MAQPEKECLGQILCPECSEPCKIFIRDYKITLSDCKNNHKKENLTMSEYQEIKKKQTQKNDKKFHICEKHNLNYEKYCEECKKNICQKCEEEHKGHNLLIIKEIIPDKNELKKNGEQLKTAVNKFKANIKDIINQLNKACENVEKFYAIHNEIADSYEGDNLNYEKAQNLAEINNTIAEEIFNFNEMDYGYNLNKVLYISNEIEGKNVEIELNYKINKNGENDQNEGEGEENTIKVFGPEFVKSNMDLCQIIHNNQKSELIDKVYLFDEDKEKDIYTIKLRGVNNLRNFVLMFNNCTNLVSVKGLSKLDTSKITRMGCMFSGCHSLESLDDISNWNTSNVTSMGNLFNDCRSLKSLPDISKWDVSSCTELSSIFSGCTNLTSLPDISKWNIRNAI